MDKELKKRLDRALTWANVWGIVAFACLALEKEALSIGPVFISLIYLAQAAFIMIKLRRK